MLRLCLSSGAEPRSRKYARGSGADGHTVSPWDRPRRSLVMVELVELMRYIEQQRYTEALDLIAEMDEISREDKINKIYSFAEILLLHLIKQEVEKRTMRSWDLTIRNAV